MKKRAFILALVLGASLTACGQQSTETVETTETVASIEETETESTTPVEETQEVETEQHTEELTTEQAEMLEAWEKGQEVAKAEKQKYATILDSITPMDKELYAVEIAEIWEYPDTESSILGTIEKGTLVHITGMVTNENMDWYQMNDSTGELVYLQANQFKESEPQPTTEVQQPTESQPTTKPSTESPTAPVQDDAAVDNSPAATGQVPVDSNGNPMEVGQQLDGGTDLQGNHYTGIYRGTSQEIMEKDPIVW